MKQMIEKFVNVSQVGSYYADLVNFVSYINSKYGTTLVAATPCVILGSIFIWMYIKCCWRSNRGPPLPNPPLPRPPLARSKSLAELHGGDLALQRFLAHGEASANRATVGRAPEILLEALLQQEYLDFKYMQSPVAKLEMYGREEAAVEMLKKAQKAHADRPHEVYEIEMLLVELLIYQGDYDKAYACKCLHDEDITDARRPFFKAIIHMLGHKKESEAKKCWEEFMDIRRQFIEIKPTSFMHALEGEYDKIDFEKFKKKVKELESAIISHAAEKKKAM